MTTPLPAATAAGPRPRSRSRGPRGRLTFDRVSFMVVFLGVPLALFLLFVISPFIQALYYGMTDWSGFSPDFNVVGFSNYTKLVQDDTFRKSVINNILLAIVVPFATIVISLLFASLVTVAGGASGGVRGLRGSSFYRIVSFFPYTVPAIVIGIIWAQVYDPQAGLLNGILTGVGIDKFKSFAWLGEVSTAMPASMFVMVWALVGFYTVLFVAAIKGVPAEIYEAARLDGCGRIRTIWSVTLPLIRDNVQTAWIYLGIAALDAFVWMQALNPFGGPNNSTLVMPQELFNTAFAKGQFGYATAMGVVLAIVTLVYAGLVFLVFRLVGGRESGERL